MNAILRRLSIFHSVKSFTDENKQVFRMSLSKVAQGIIFGMEKMYSEISHTFTHFISLDSIIAPLPRNTVIFAVYSFGVLCFAHHVNGSSCYSPRMIPGLQHIAKDLSLSHFVEKT